VGLENIKKADPIWQEKNQGKQQLPQSLCGIQGGSF